MQILYLDNVLLFESAPLPEALGVIEMTLLPLHNQINLKSTNYYVIKVLLLVLRLFLEL